MLQLHGVSGRAFLLASLVAASISIMASGGLGSQGKASGCPTAGLHPDVSAVETSGPRQPRSAAQARPPQARMPPPRSTPARRGCRPVTASPSWSASAVPSPAAALTVGIEARDPYFSPTELSVPAAGATRLVLTNHGYVAHNLTIDELGIQLVATRGGTDELTLVDPTAGVYTFYCSISGHREAGMEGTLTIE